jgi:hypothetical protein
MNVQAPAPGSTKGLGAGAFDTSWSSAGVLLADVGCQAPVLSKMATVSTWYVCGNMSTGTARTAV